MNQKSFIYLGILAIFGISTVAILYAFSNRINHSRNSFIRLIPSHTIAPLKTLDLKVNSYYIASVSSNKIYLGNMSNPTILTAIDFDFNSLQSVPLKSDSKDTLKGFKAARLYIDSPNIVLADGSNAVIMEGTLSKYALKTDDFKAPYFTLAVPISVHSMILRTYSDKDSRNVLTKIQFNSEAQTSNDTLLQSQQDGVFSTDGMMTYDKQSNSIIYLYYYRNQFIRFDTDLHFLSTGRTIDTNSVAKITVADVKSKNLSTLSSKPLVVNKNLSVNNNRLYIYSGLLSKNEDRRSYQNSSVIDVYDLSANKYLFSFYLPDFAGKKVKSFMVKGRYIFAIYGRYLVSYTLDLSHLRL